MKYSLIIATIFFSTGVMANSASVQFDATVEAECSVVATQTGAITLNGQIITTTTPAQANISNNAAGAFNISISPPTTFSIKPAAFTGNTNTHASYDLSGQNPGVSLSGTSTLSNEGSDTISLSLTGSSNQTFLPGSYQLMAVVSCDAI